MRHQRLLAAATLACLALASLPLVRRATAQELVPEDGAATSDPSVAPPAVAPSEAPAPSSRGGQVVVPTAPRRAELQEIVVEAAKPLSAASSQEIRARDFELRPHGTLIEVLNNVPGLVVSQHQGGAKAPQWLIRGFDADHGTDFAVFADGVPVNLVSHAHGQGYADMSYLIPESIEGLQLWKGPYFARFGDFMNAGALEITTKDEVAESSVYAEGGSFDSARFVFQASPRIGAGKTYLAAQASHTNGPFDHPQNLWAYNFLAKYTAEPTPSSRLQAQAIVYDADWDASGQIPLRAVDGVYPDGTPFAGPRLDRFGAVDPTEGGKTDYQSVNLVYAARPEPSSHLDLQAYAFRYRLKLWSDFTFFRFTGLRFMELPDGGIVDTGDGPVVPGASYVPGDQIEQSDQRWTFGANGTYAHDWEPFGLPAQSRVGIQNRNDRIDLSLWRSVRRQRFFAVNQIHTDESSFSGWADTQIFPNDWIRLELGLRGDLFLFDVSDRLPDQALDPNFESQAIRGNRTSGIVSPKANLVLSPTRETEIYLNFGTGFHSNDARVAILAPDFDPLSRSYGWELGSRTQPIDRLDLAAAFWFLDLDSELVFSGDAGTVDAEIDDSTGVFVPGPASRRYGIDFEARYPITDWLWADYDLSWAHAELRDGGNVPLAPRLLMNGGLTARFDNGFSWGMRLRYVGDRPANEDDTLTAQGYFLVDMLAAYRWRNVQLSLNLLNLGDAGWREAQFADQTCLESELGTRAGCPTKPGLQPGDGVEDIHFTPGSPFAVRGGIQVFF